MSPPISIYKQKGGENRVLDRAYEAFKQPENKWHVGLVPPWHFHFRQLNHRLPKNSQQNHTETH